MNYLEGLRVKLAQEYAWAMGNNPDPGTTQSPTPTPAPNGGSPGVWGKIFGGGRGLMLGMGLASAASALISSLNKPKQQPTAPAAPPRSMYSSQGRAAAGLKMPSNQPTGYSLPRA